MKALLTASFLALSIPAQAQQYCGPYAQMEQTLANEYNEAVIATGWMTQTSILVVFATKDGDTFTVLSVNNKGVACVLTSGRGWSDETMPGKPA